MGENCYLWLNGLKLQRKKYFGTWTQDSCLFCCRLLVHCKWHWHICCQNAQQLASILLDQLSWGPKGQCGIAQLIIGCGVIDTLGDTTVSTFFLYSILFDRTVHGALLCKEMKPCIGPSCILLLLYNYKILRYHNQICPIWALVSSY